MIIAMRERAFLSLIVVSIILLLTQNSALGNSERMITMSAGFGAPYTLPNKTGFYDILGKELFKRINHRFTLMSLPPKRAIHSANNGDTDGDLQRIIGLEEHFPNLVRVPEIINQFNFVAFSKLPATEVKNWDDLNGLRVGYIRGWAFYEQNIPDGARVILADNPRQLMSLINFNRVDVILYSKWMGLWWAQKLAINIHLLAPPLRTENMYIYLNKKHLPLVAQLAKALKQMNEEGRYQQIITQTMVPLLK